MNIDRRSLLLASTAAARMMYAQSREQVLTAVIGVGGRGSYLLRGILEQPDAKVAALCDIKPERLDKAATAAARQSEDVRRLAPDHRTQGHRRSVHRHPTVLALGYGDRVWRSRR